MEVLYCVCKRRRSSCSFSLTINLVHRCVFTDNKKDPNEKFNFQTQIRLLYWTSVYLAGTVIDSSVVETLHFANSTIEAEVG